MLHIFYLGLVGLIPDVVYDGSSLLHTLVKTNIDCPLDGIFFKIFKTVLSSGYILILLSIEYILASLIETCQG